MNARRFTLGFLLVAFSLMVLGGAVWADIKPKTTTATRDIVLVEEEAEEAKKEEGQATVNAIRMEEMHKNDFEVTLESDHKDAGDVYAIGDKLALTFKSEVDGYLTLLDFTSSGQIVVLFPNKWVESNLVKAGQEIRVPAEGQKYSMKVGGPIGVDIVKAIVTNNPVPVFNPENQELAGPFSILKDSKAATRDILLVAEDETASEPVSADSLKWGVASLPIMTKDPQKADALTGFAVEQNGDWMVKMWVGRPSYLTGELVFVKLFSNQPAKLVSLVNLGASENQNRLLPEDISEVALNANEIMVLPGKADKWKLVAASKTGKDTLQAVLKRDDGTELKLTLDVMVEE